MSKEKPAGDLGFALLAGGVSLGFFLSTMGPSLTWSNWGGDGGELTLAAAFLGVPHPSGYPVFVLLGRLFCFIPLGDYAFRTNLLSAVAGASSAIFLALSLGILNRRSSWNLPAWLPGAMGLILVLGENHWRQSIITEVYSLNAMLGTATLWMLLRGFSAESASDRGRWIFRGCLIWGVNLGVHLTSAFLGLGILSSLFLSDRSFFRRRWFRFSAAAVTGTVLGLYSLLPIFAMGRSPVNSEYIRSAPDLIQHVSGRAYSDRLPHFSVAGFLFGFSERFIPLLASEWGPGGCLLILLGILRVIFGGFRGKGSDHGKGFLVWAAFWFPGVWFASNYQIIDYNGLFLVPVLLTGLFIGPGVGILLDLPGKLGGPRLSGMISFLLFAVLFGSVTSKIPRIDLSQELYPLRFGEILFQKLPPGAIVFSETDAKTNSLMYQKWLGKNARKDVAVIPRVMLKLPWYRDLLAQQHREILIPPLKMEYLALHPDTLCDNSMLDIIRANPDRPHFTVHDRESLAKELFFEMYYGIFRISFQPPSPPREKFGERFLPIDLSSVANADYRENPFGRDLGGGDSFPTLGNGLLDGEIPFWLEGPRRFTGRNSVLAIPLAATFSSRLPLEPRPTKAVHAVLIGYMADPVRQGFPHARIIYRSSESPWEPLLPSGDKATKGVSPATGNQASVAAEESILRFDRFSLQASSAGEEPEFLEIRHTPLSGDGYPSGAAITFFGVTQEVASPASETSRH